MGRPLNKKYFGEPTPTGNEIKVQFFNGTASVNGWIIKQLGSKRFRCTDGTAIADCVLTDSPSAGLVAGQMSITVKDDAGNIKQTTKITGRKVTLNTGEGIAWNFTSDITDAAVEMEEAGDDAVIDAIGIDEDDFEGDDV